MKIITTFKENIIPVKYAKGAENQFLIAGNPVLSFPFEIVDIPKGTQALAWTFIDYDAVPVCVFPWIHWLAYTDCNQHDYKVSEGASRNEDKLIQGKNSFVTGLIDVDFSEIDEYYVGPTPPDKDHQYNLTVFALDKKIDLSRGYFYNDLLKEVKDKIIEQTEVQLVGKM